jgi:hypothetical protein
VVPKRVDLRATSGHGGLAQVRAPGALLLGFAGGILGFEPCCLDWLLLCLPAELHFLAHMAMAGNRVLRMTAKCPILGCPILGCPW